MSETWKDGGAYPNKYDRVCKECGTKIPKDGRDYFYRTSPGGGYESMCRACMNKVPAAPAEHEPDALIDELMMIREALAQINETLKAQGAH